MNLKQTIVFTGLYLLAGISAATPKDDVSNLLVKSKPAVVTFSDGRSTWTGQKPRPGFATRAGTFEDRTDLQTVSDGLQAPSRFVILTTLAFY